MVRAAARGDHLAQQAVGARQNDEGDENRSDLIHPVESGEEDHEARNDHGSRAEQISEHLEIRPTHVEALFLAAAQNEQRDQVRETADHGRHDHRSRLHLDLTAEATDGLDEDEDRDDAEHYAVDERGEHLDSQVAEGALARCRQARDQARDERDRDSSCVGEHVPGICEQRERPRDHCTDELHEHNGQRDAEREDQPLPVLRRACRAAACRPAGACPRLAA